MVNKTQLKKSPMGQALFQLDKEIDDFIERVANECVDNMSEKEKEYIGDHPRAIDLHPGDNMSINQYNWSTEAEAIGIDMHPEELWVLIKSRIVSIVTGYGETDTYIQNLFEHKSFASLRRAYRGIYGEYPNELIEKYRKEYPDQPSGRELMCLLFGFHYQPDKSNPAEMEGFNRKERVICRLISEVAEKVWKVDEIRARANECGIENEVVEERIDTVKRALFDDDVYIPMSYVLLLSGKEIGDDLYEECRKEIYEEYKNNPKMMSKIV